MTALKKTTAILMTACLMATAIVPLSAANARDGRQQRQAYSQNNNGYYVGNRNVYERTYRRADRRQMRRQAKIEARREARWEARQREIARQRELERRRHAEKRQQKRRRNDRKVLAAGLIGLAVGAIITNSINKNNRRSSDRYYVDNNRRPMQLGTSYQAPSYEAPTYQAPNSPRVLRLEDALAR